MKPITLIVIFLLSASFVFAQSESGRAAMEGIITDPSGSVVPNARISLRDNNTGLQREAQTNAEGQFHLAALPVGDYRVEISANGFSKAVSDHVVLNVGETKTLSVAMQLPSVATEVTVEASADLISQTDVSNSVTIDERAIADLPIRARNFTEFVQLSPNTAQESNRFGIVVNGQRSINLNISLDGVDYTDPLQNGPRGGGSKESAFFLPQSAVREFQVVLNGVSAEIGRTNSSYVNVVTKSGGNTVHSEGFYYNRNGALTSPDAFGNDTSSNSQHQLGGSFGGPIQKDRLFFFAAVEKNLLTAPYTVKFTKPSTSGLVVPADIAAQEGTFDQHNNPLVALGRLDYRLNRANTLDGQYMFANQRGLNSGISGQVTAASTNNIVKDRLSHAVKMGLTTIITPNLLNQVRSQWAMDNRSENPNIPKGASNNAEIDINDFGTLGGVADGTFIYNATRTQLLDNVSWTHGAHSIKFGGDMNFSPELMQREKNYGGAYTFNTLADYLAALAGNKSKIARYQQTIAANGKQGFYEGQQNEFALYITDTMKLRRDFTLTAGLRWEGQMNPQFPVNPQHPLNGPIPNDWKMWQPRLGFVYDIGGKGKSVIRASAGIFDSRTPAYIMHRIGTDNGINTLFLDSSVDPNVINYLTVPYALSTVPAALQAAVNSIYAFDPTFRNPRSGQVSIAFEQQLDRATKVTVGFTRNATWALQRRLDRNLYAPVVFANGMAVYPTQDSAGHVVPATSWNDATGLPVYLSSTGAVLKQIITRPDPTIGQFNVNESIGHSTYNGGYISVQRRMSHHLQFGANYTYSTSRDDDSNERDYNRQYELNTFNLKGDAAYAKNDIRHNANFNAVYELPAGFTVSSLLFTHSGSPGRFVLGSDIQNDGNKDNDRPVINGKVAPRDSIRLLNFFDWDLRLTKEIRLGENTRIVLTAEGFNLTSATNKSFNSDGDSVFGKPQTTLNPNTGYFYANNTAGIPQSSPGTDRFGGPRQAQLGIRFVY
jgi:hypothetical protein